MPEKSIESELLSATDADTVRRARDRSLEEVDLTLETSRQTIREAWDAIKRADEVLARS
jgi:hypothetical protein